MDRYKDYVLDPFQQDALDAIRNGLNVIVAAPTGCGKTLVAEYAIERALERGRRVIYTAPIKALSNQKFRDFGAAYGDRVGIMTGDVTINPTADAIIMTTEIFRNTIFDNPAKLEGIEYVILDEAHYLDDPERGTVWEESIIFAPPAIRFIALSATISNLSEFAAWVRRVRPGGLRVVLETRRPVPLRPFVFTGEQVVDLRLVQGRGFGVPPQRRGKHDRDGRGGRPRRGPPNFVAQNFRLIDEVVARGHLPCIFFLFSRDFCEKMAQGCADRDLVSRDERDRLVAHWEQMRRTFDLPATPEVERLGRLLVRGIAYHHAGMLPTLKEVVERLFTSGLLKLLFATETFSLGVNMPARAVAFESLKKFDGVKRDYMKTREFLQMAGRAGRRGMDREGFVYTCVAAAEERPGDVRRVMTGDVEAIESQFNLSYATLLSLYAHLGEGIYTACEQSFIHFRHKKRKGAPYLDMISQVKRRIRLLQETGYLDGRRLTTKGRFASLIYGYEIQAAELWEAGLFRELGPHELALLVTGLVYEAKRDTWSVSMPRGILEPIRRVARDRIDAFRDRELVLGVAVPTKRPDFTLARAVWEWTHGADFETLGQWADVSSGDLVRAFRLAIQLLRQLAKPLRFVDEDTTRFKQRLREAARLMKRGEVDAERQLRQAVEVEAGEAAAARIPAEVDVADEGAVSEPSLAHVLTPPSHEGDPMEAIVEIEAPEQGEAAALDEGEGRSDAALYDDDDAPAARAPPGRAVAAPDADMDVGAPRRGAGRPSAGDFGWLPSEEAEEEPAGPPSSAPGAPGRPEPWDDLRGRGAGRPGGAGRRGRGRARFSGGRGRRRGGR